MCSTCLCSRSGGVFALQVYTCVCSRKRMIVFEVRACVRALGEHLCCSSVHIRRCAPVNTLIYIQLRHKHTCAELENNHVLLGKQAHTHVYTWNTHMCSPTTRYCVHVGAHMRVHLEHNESRVQFRQTCAYTWCVHLEQKHVQLKHTCVYTWGTHTYTTGTQICAPEHRVCNESTHVYTRGTHSCRVYCFSRKHMCVPRPCDRALAQQHLRSRARSPRYRTRLPSLSSGTVLKPEARQRHTRSNATRARFTTASF